MSGRLEFTRKTKEARAIHAGWLCEAIWEGKRCNVELTAGRIEYHHEVEAERGGDNSFDNCRATCIPCHRLLTKAFVQAKAKAERQRAVQLNSTAPATKPLPLGKTDSRKAKIGGGVAPRERAVTKPSLPPRALYININQGKAR